MLSDYSELPTVFNDSMTNTNTTTSSSNSSMLDMFHQTQHYTLPTNSGEDEQTEMLQDDATPITFGENKKARNRRTPARHQETTDVFSTGESDDKLSTLFNTTGRERNSTGPLKQWLFEHQHHPYPKESDKQDLMEKTKMSLAQITVWFTNARVKMRKENKLPQNLYGKKRKRKQQDETITLDETLSPPLPSENMTINDLEVSSFEDEQLTPNDDMYMPTNNSTNVVMVCPSIRPVDTRLVLAYSCLNAEQITELRRLTSLFPEQVSLTDCVDERTTHLITGNEQKPLLCPLTIKVFRAIARHLFVISHRWIVECLKQQQIVDESPFEIRGDIPFGDFHDGMRHSRLSTHDGLFSNCQLHIMCNGCQDKMSKTELASLIRLCNGNLLDTLPLSSTGSLTVVICDRLTPFADDIQQELFNTVRSNGVQFLGPEWVLESIVQYALQPFDQYEEKF